MLGRTIQNYRVEELLGEGGMGTVYKASDVVLRRHVALKMLHNHLVRDSGFMERFHNEAVLSAQLNHPNVATLYNFFQHQNENLIVMELVHGVTVEHFLKKQGRLPVETAVKIVIQTLDGLQHAHSRGILHRDIKAANLMLTPEGLIKLMDFGIARLEGSTRLTRADRVVGTLEYMAPELLNGTEPSVQSDLYAVGVLLYELLCGQMPFESSTDISLISQILTKKPVALKSRVSGIPKSIEEILERLFQKKPEKRYRSAGELRMALATVAAPGHIDNSFFQATPKATAPIRASIDTGKRGASPTRLAATELSQSQGLSWNSIKSNMLSLEGAILAGALVLATGIISVWSFSGSPERLERADSLAVHQVTIKPQTSVDDTLAESKVINTATPSNFTETTPQSIAEIPQDTYVPIPEKKRRVTRKPVAEVPSEAVKPVEKEVEVQVQARPVRKTTLELRGESFTAEFTQKVSSEESSAGQTFWLQTVTPVEVNGTLVIHSGARVKGRVERTISKADHKRSGLWIRLEAVEAIDGQWIPLNFKWDDTAFHALELERGFRFKRIRTERTTITLAQ